MSKDSFQPTPEGIDLLRARLISILDYAEAALRDLDDEPHLQNKRLVVQSYLPLMKSSLVKMYKILGLDGEKLLRQQEAFAKKENDKGNDHAASK